MSRIVRRTLAVVLGLGLAAPVAATSAAPASAAAACTSYVAITTIAPAPIERRVRFHGESIYVGTRTASVCSGTTGFRPTQVATLQRRIVGRSWKSVATYEVVTDGMFGFETTAVANAHYRVILSAGTGPSGDTYSSAVSAKVRLSVSRHVVDGHRRNGKIIATVLPRTKGQKVVVQARRGGRWVTTYRTRVTSRSKLIVPISKVPLRRGERPDRRVVIEGDRLFANTVEFN